MLARALCTQTRDDLRGEFAEGVVARAKDRDRVAFCRFTNEFVSDGGAFGDVNGVAAGIADSAGEPFRSFRPVDRSALIDGITEVEPVVGAKTPCWAAQLAAVVVKGGRKSGPIA